ncbi:hypothetical protein [Phormidesmis sp. 146-33]
MAQHTPEFEGIYNSMSDLLTQRYAIMLSMPRLNNQHRTSVMANNQLE